ncbi:MAG: hypothetical protein HC800_16705 [Phormidesmis sp. RL_2_1]|nr:hypothetical protein [Phormidesmis sp. RL_2_1]
MLKPSLIRGIVGASTFCFIQSLSSAVSAQSQTALLPLQPRTVKVDPQFTRLDTAERNINTKIEVERNTPIEPIGIDFDSLPIVGEFLDREGNFDMGFDLPVDISVADVMGETGVVLGIRF